MSHNRRGPKYGVCVRPVGLTLGLAVFRGLLLIGAACAVAGAAPSTGRARESWVSTWATAQQLTPQDMPSWVKPPPKEVARASPIPQIPERLKNRTVRMVVRSSIGGRQVRVQLSNAYGMPPVTIGSAHVALRAPSGSSIDPSSDRTVTFGGSRTFPIAPGAVIVSDPVDLAVSPLTELVVSLYIPEDTSQLTVHPLGLHTTYIADGEVAGSPQLAGAQQNRSYFWLTGVEVLAPEGTAAAIVAFGDSITDGFGTTPDTDRAWPALLARRLQSSRAPQARASPRDVGEWSVLNLGISGNRLLHDGAGTNGVARFDRDVLSRPGVRWIILLEGINDLSFPAIPGAPPSEHVTRDELIQGYREFIEKAHVHGIKIAGATILPWEGVWTFNESAERSRQELNEWIRKSGAFDAVIDFDLVMRDPDHPRRLAARFDSGDHVHPNDAGNEAMAEAVDLARFGK